MGPVDVNGSVHTARRQHQRKNVPICVRVASRVLCEWDLTTWQRTSTEKSRHRDPEPVAGPNLPVAMVKDLSSRNRNWVYCQQIAFFSWKESPWRNKEHQIFTQCFSWTSAMKLKTHTLPLPLFTCQNPAPSPFWAVLCPCWRHPTYQMNQSSRVGLVLTRWTRAAGLGWYSPDEPD